MLTKKMAKQHGLCFFSTQDLIHAVNKTKNTFNNLILIVYLAEEE